VDGHRFDRFARTFASVNRRQLLRLLAGAIGGGLGAALPGTGRRAGSQAKTCTIDADCSGGEKCCSGTCRNTQSDAAHCGLCDSPCPSTNPTCCSGNCRNLKESPDNCGSCGNACPEGEFCTSGECCTHAGVCGNLCCKGGESCLGLFSGQTGCCPARQACREVCCAPEEDCLALTSGSVCCLPDRACPQIDVCCNLGDVCATGGPLVICCPEFRFCNGTCCPEGQICIGGECARDPALDATPTSGQDTSEEVTADLGCCRCGANPKTKACQAANSEAECIQYCGEGKTYVFDAHATCEGKVCKPKAGDDYGCCTCLSNRNKGCVNVSGKSDCLTYCDTKDEKDIGFQTNRSCAVSEAGDRYTCHTKPTSSDQASCIPDEDAYRLLVTAADVPPSPGDLGVEGLVRLEGRLTFGASGLPGLSRGQRQTFADAGVVGAYLGAIGTPNAVAIATRQPSGTSFARAVGRLQNLRRARAQVDDALVRQQVTIVVNVCEAGAIDRYPDYVKWTLDGAKTMENPPSLGTDEETTGLAEVADAETGQQLLRAVTVARAGSVFLAAETVTNAGDEATTRALHETGMLLIKDRFEDLFDDTAEPAASDLISVLPATDQMLGYTFNGSVYIPTIGVTPEMQAFQQQAFSGVEAMLAAGAPFSTTPGGWQASVGIVKFPGRDEAVAFTDRIAQDNAVLANVGSFGLEDLDLGGGVAGTLTAFRGVDVNGAIVANVRSYTRVGSWFADAQLFGPVVSDTGSAFDSVEATIPGLKQALTDVLMEQASCIKAGVCPALASPLRFIFGDAGITATVDVEEPEPETAQFPNVLSVYAGAELAARIGNGWRAQPAKKCFGFDGCLAAGLPSTDQHTFSASILKGYEFSTVLRGDDGQPAETTRDHYVVFSDQTAIASFFDYARTLVPADAEDETPRLGRSDLLFAWRYPVTLDGGGQAIRKTIGTRAGDLGLLFSHDFIAGTPSLAAVEERAGRTLDLLGSANVADASRLVWPMPYLFGPGIDAAFDIRLLVFDGQELPWDDEEDEGPRDLVSLADVINAARIVQSASLADLPFSFDFVIEGRQYSDEATAEDFLSGARTRFGQNYNGFTVEDVTSFGGLGDQSAGYLYWGQRPNGQFWAGATGFVRRGTWVGSFGFGISTDQITPDLEANVQEGSFLTNPVLSGLQYQMRLWDGIETERGLQLDIKYPIDDRPETPPAILGDGKVVPWLSMGSLAQADDFGLEVRLQHSVRCVRPGALPGLTRSEAQASRTLSAQEAFDLKYDDYDGPPIAMTGFARFKDQQAAWNAFDWYSKVEYPGLVRREATAPFAGYAYDLSFIPNLKLGTLEPADWTRFIFPYGNLGVAVFARGDDPIQAQNLGNIVLDRLEQGEPRGGGLDTTMIQLAGSHVQPYLTFSPLVLDGTWIAQPGEDAAAVQARADETPDHEDWLRSQQDFKTSLPAVNYALVDEKRRFASQAAAQAWFADIEGRLTRTFIGINLLAITEASPLAKPNGLADEIKAFLIDYRPSPAQVNAGLLIYALFGSVVATLNLRGVSESAEDQAVIDFFAWLFREGGLPLALFGVEVMSKELQLLNRLIPIDGDDDDDDDDDEEDDGPRYVVGPEHVYGQ
jgi:hypothetical protein